MLEVETTVGENKVGAGFRCQLGGVFGGAIRKWVRRTRVVGGFMLGAQGEREVDGTEVVAVRGGWWCATCWVAVAEGCVWRR